MKPQVYPVIHYLSDTIALEQAAIAHNCGSHGVFLISHAGQDDCLAPLALVIKKRFHCKVGINYLTDGALLAIDDAKTYGLDMVWSDTCGVSSNGFEPLAYRIEEEIKNSKIDFFGSVAFKYQSYEAQPAKAAHNAKSLGFIPTTSGQATGEAPEIEKIISMAPVAIASGMTAQNIDIFKPYLSHILVSTGISLDEHHFCPEKLKQFMSKI